MVLDGVGERDGERARSCDHCRLSLVHGGQTGSPETEVADGCAGARAVDIVVSIEHAVVDDEEKGALAMASVADGLSESVSGCTRVRQPFPSAALIYFLYLFIYSFIKTLPRHSIPIFSYFIRFFLCTSTPPWSK